MSPEPEAAEIEACEAAADALEQQWGDDREAEALADELGDEIGRTREAQQWWEVDGDKTAAWAIGKIADATTERDRIRRNAQDAIEQIQAKALRDEARSTRTIEFMTGKLIEYRRRLEAENPKLPKTYPLANGDLCVRVGRKSTKVTDEPALVAWLRDTESWEALTMKPKVSELSDLPRDGEGRLIAFGAEIVPGVVTVQGEPSYSVKPSINPDPF